MAVVPGRSTRPLERMPKWKPGATVAAFVVADLVFTSISPLVASWLVESLLAGAFAWAYLVSGGSRASAVAWVIVVSVVCPLIILAVVGSSAYQSWGQLWSSTLQGARFVAFVAPVLVASVVVAARGKHAF
jgi:hypothetical protein